MRGPDGRAADAGRGRTGPAMILLIDNYDSFTYNLVQRLGEIDPGLDLRVVRNDRITPDEVEALAPSHLIISPGPCTPREAGVSNDLIARFAPRLPILGVCLGHQCIGHTFGAEVVRADRIMHGKTSMIHHDGRGIYRGMPDPFEATRYHSLVIRPGTLPPELEVVAQTDQGEIMGVRHKTYPLEGVQYHPESFLTREGTNLLKNFIGR
ncbi:MAG TPA: aminodeoxychorismate/anthranilate synthase component II [Isosphaeraceae bacterium]|jgi:anthranilate synthase/aminodeoxychorismate synthase-like glutamine amidotransferase|nr:aminodeoxychorismate/anthranilate synthase component II [Isosphaeraceae bacterium]